ncbi:MAG TPA: hypothetical protein DIU15_02770, partial [Deltaproteobacteria bacterium]|nr:hypothetical protein [Deltaproteobacteria bacterium]
QVLRKTGLGARARAVELPWAYLGVELQNSGDRAISVLLASRVVDGSGQDAPAFRPNLRKYDSDTGVVTVLLRVPPGQRARGALPLFVDPGELGHGALEFERILEVTPLGSNEPLLVRRQDLVVDQGNPLATFGFLAVVLAALVGLGLVTLRGPGWLGSQATSTLMTVALFGNLIFVLAAASHLVGMGFGAFLGPFSSLVTGLLDEAFRFALLATLITLLPAPGIVTLTLVVSALMRGIALGAFTPGDLLVLCSSVVWLEASLWLVGITRGTRWRDEGRVLRWARLSVG